MNYKVIYTKSLDNASFMDARSWEYANKSDAIDLFNEELRKLMNECIENEFLNVQISKSKYKALIKIESEHHCLAIVDDMNVPIQ